MCSNNNSNKKTQNLRVRNIRDLSNHATNKPSKRKEIPRDGHAVDLERQAAIKLGVLEL